MEITIKQLIESAESLAILAQKDMPIKTSYKLGKLLNKIREELKLYEEQRNNLIKKYGKDIGGGNYQIDENDEEAINKFKKEHEELINLTVNIEYEPISLDSLGDIKISPMHMANLDLFIC
ncbi:MAG: hypothetical protein QXD05_01455 [Candidatus Pacearchaeota archaeon]